MTAPSVIIPPAPEQKPTHSPLPWHVFSARGSGVVMITAGVTERGPKSTVLHDPNATMAEADADFACRAVNNHEALRTAVAEAVETDADVVQALRLWAPQLLLNCAPGASEAALLMAELADRVEARINERRKVLAESER